MKVNIYNKKGFNLKTGWFMTLLSSSSEVRSFKRAASSTVVEQCSCSNFLKCWFNLGWLGSEIESKHQFRDFNGIDDLVRGITAIA